MGSCLTGRRSIVGRRRPMELSAGAVQVGGGYGHSVVRLADGTVKATGMNDHGQLGDGTTTPRTDAGTCPGSHRGTDRRWGHARPGSPGGWDGRVLGAWPRRAARLSHCLGGRRPALAGTRPESDRCDGDPGRQLLQRSDHRRWRLDLGLVHWCRGQGVWGTPLLVGGTEGATDVALGGHHGLFLIDGVPLDLPDPVVTTMSVESDPDPAYVGEPVTFTVTVDPARDMGPIEMGEDATGPTQTAPIDPSTGSATFTDSFAFASAAHKRFFRFDGVPGFEASQGSITLAVERRPTTIALSRPGRAHGRSYPRAVTRSDGHARDRRQRPGIRCDRPLVAGRSWSRGRGRSE